MGFVSRWLTEQPVPVTLLTRLRDPCGTAATSSGRACPCDECTLLPAVRSIFESQIALVQEYGCLCTSLCAAWTPHDDKDWPSQVDLCLC
mmetsp:Transcript_23092/g.61453  ORF Transcript_23092/g.61453 Transcript_23092/m.61453 type:complete len:90 (-) Transcript_23092:7-276(-)